MARDFKPTEMIDTWRRRNPLNTWPGSVASNLRRSTPWQYGDSSSQVGRVLLGWESGWPRWWCLVDETGTEVCRCAAAWSRDGSPFMGRHSERKEMRPPKMAAASKIAPGLSLAATTELIFSLFRTVISDDHRTRTRCYRRLDVGSGM